MAGRAGPLDGVTTSYADREAVAADARRTAGLGFAGKLLIHPAQVAPAAAGFAPTPAEIAWAEAILAASPSGGPAGVSGTMVDAPVRLRAERILSRGRRRLPP